MDTTTQVGDPEDQDLGDDWRDPPPERIATASQRRLPDFVIIGTQRGGTTSLYRYLTRHPDVGRSFRKEVHYFDRYYEKGMDWYQAHFPLQGEEPFTGEASPYYLFHPETPKRIQPVLPDAKFIVLLRNPVDRAYSHYNMIVRRGVESLSFEDAIAKEDERLSATDDPASLTWRHYSYRRRGEYADQIRRWLAIFPRDQLLLITSERFFRDPARILAQTQAYLGLKPHHPRTFKPFHLSNYPPMAAATRHRLAEYFAPHNRQLYDLIDTDLEWDDGIQ